MTKIRGGGGVLLVVLSLGACSDDGGGAAPDAAWVADASAVPDAATAPDATPPDAAPPDANLGPCTSACGPAERCDAVTVGLDDDCDGEVDEGCACAPGSAQACFKGDPAFVTQDGCYAGSQVCTPAGVWGPCEGGAHATESCYAYDPAGCHPIASAPFVTVDLSAGLGAFGADATSDAWSVACPAGVSPCPAPSGASFQPLDSGEYTVTYQKTTGTGMESCTFPLFVGAPGLRVTLAWEWETGLGSDTVDLDVHLHKPGDTSPWGGDSGNASVCAWDNCTASDFQFGGGVLDWFGIDSWRLDPVFENNTCYFAPKGNGEEWQSLGMGCHSPRLDMDNIVCDPTVTDPQASSFCNAENVNIDAPPLDQWTRIGVHYYSAHGQTYDVHPRVSIYCDGRLAAELGAAGYDSPVTFAPADGNDAFWLVGDVVFRTDVCGNVRCDVVPLYQDTGAHTPLLSTVSEVQASFGPAYPALP